MRTYISKKQKEEAIMIIKKYGYWSDELQLFLSKYRYDVSYKFNNILKCI